MAETAAVKAAKTAPAPAAPVAASAAVTPIRAQKLRESQIKKFVPSALKGLGFGKYDRLTIEVSLEWSFAECMAVGAWANVAGVVAEDALKTRQNMVSSIIELHHPKFYADLIIRDVVRDQFGGPCGLKLSCLGPAQDKDGRAAPRDLETGLPWSDPAIEEEAK